MRDDEIIHDSLLADLFVEALDSGTTDRSPLPDWANEDFPYEFQEFVGRGGSGFVWKARHRESDAIVALKVIVFQGDVVTARERWLREARIAGAVSHEHLVEIRESGLAPDEISAWLALEWIEGGDLLQYLLKNGALSWETLEPWVLDACRGLRELHQAGLIHRDLKPSNLLLEEKSGRLVISDFGAALEISEERVTRTTDALLSFGYAAPEQLKIGRVVDGRADQFSLAVTIWELLTGELPMGAFPKLRSQNPKAPFWLDSVLRKALSRNPEDRFEDLDDFCKALQPGPHRWRRGLKVCALLGLCVAGAYGVNALRKEPPAPIVKYQDQNFRSLSVRVVEDVDVFIRFNITVSPDGFISGIVTTYSEETWRGMKTQGAVALKNAEGEALLVLVMPPFGVTGEIHPGNGSSRTDYIQGQISPEVAQQVAELHFMAHPANDQPNSPWNLDYSKVVKRNTHSSKNLIDHQSANVERRAKGAKINKYPSVQAYDPTPQDK